MNAWDNLVNARHIDFVIDLVKKHPGEWVAAYNATWDAARDAAYNAAWDAATDASWYATMTAVGDSILALVAYDDCEQYLDILDMSYNELLFMSKLTELPATILLLPYAKAMELIKEKV